MPRAKTYWARASNVQWRQVLRDLPDTPEHQAFKAKVKESLAKQGLDLDAVVAPSTAAA